MFSTLATSADRGKSPTRLLGDIIYLFINLGSAPQQHQLTEENDQLGPLGGQAMLGKQ